MRVSYASANFEYSNIRIEPFLPNSAPYTNKS